MIKKLFEIKYGQWEKALSHETTDFVNGIFRTFTNCDPFIDRGSFSPTRYVNEIGAGVISTTLPIRKIHPAYATSSGQMYALADNYKLYLIDNDDTVTDVSAQIASGTATAIDLAKWNNKLIYATSGQVRQNVYPVASGSDAHLMTVIPTSNFCVGPDRNGYIGISNNVGKFTIAGGTASAVAASLETNNIVKALLSAGRYLVWIADSGTTSSGKDQLTVAFWNMASSDFDDIQYFEAGSFRGAQVVGQTIKILTTNGIYETKFGYEKPVLKVPFGGTVSTSDVPLSGFFMGSTGMDKETQFFWGTYASGGNVYAYGNRRQGDPERLFQMGTIPQNYITAIASNNTRFIVAAGTSGSTGFKLYNLRGSDTYNTAVANMAGFSLGRLYTFHHARVVLKSPMSSGNSVSLQILTANSAKTVMASSTKTYITDPNERNLIFNSATGDDVRAFEDLSDVKLTTNVPIHSLEVWGEEVNNQDSYV
jgi:hypothetical protein